MVLEIALGIILAFFIMGLLEDIPSEFWAWLLGGIILIIAPRTVLTIIAILAAVYGINYLFTYIESRKKK